MTELMTTGCFAPAIKNLIFSFEAVKRFIHGVDANWRGFDYFFLENAASNAAWFGAKSSLRTKAQLSVAP